MGDEVVNALQRSEPRRHVACRGSGTGGVAERSAGRRGSRVGRGRATRAAAGAAGVDLVDLVIEARGQRGEDLVFLGLCQPTGGDGRVEILVGRGGQRRLEAVGRLAVGRGDGRQRLARGELRAQLGGRDADVGRGGVERRSGPPPRPCPPRCTPGPPPGPPPSAKSGASALASRASIAVACAFVSVPAVTWASIWSTIAFLMAAVSCAVVTPSWPAASAAIAWVWAAGDRRGALGRGNGRTTAAECREPDDADRGAPSQFACRGSDDVHVRSLFRR